MSVTLYYGDQSLRGKLVKFIRRMVSRGFRMKVYRRTADAIFRREKFSEKVPLFRSIEIETRTQCNSACGFCAANYLTDKRDDILMPDVVFEKIISDLERLGYTGKVNFFVNNEPLLDARLPQFIRMVRTRLPGASAEVHTNGLKLNERSGREMMEAGLSVLYINNYSKDGTMHRGVKAFIEQVAPQYPDRKVIFNLRRLDEQLHNRGGTAPNGAVIPEPLELPCILPFTELVVTADGRVSLCCQDHYFEEVMGNVKTQSLEEIWYGEKFRRLREHLLRSDRNVNKFCSACDFRGYREDHGPEAGSPGNRLAGPVLNG